MKVLNLVTFEKLDYSAKNFFFIWQNTFIYYLGFASKKLFQAMKTVPKVWAPNNLSQRDFEIQNSEYELH
jgi:hypothetical protein